MISRLRLWTRDTRGVAAVEFAFIAPIVILLYFGMVEFCQGYMALKRTGHTASMVADIVSRNGGAMTKQQVEEVLDIGYLIMAPYPGSGLKQRVSSVTRVDADTYRVDWSVGVGDGMDAKLLAADAEIPPALLAVDQSVIVAEAEYDYKSPFDRVSPVPAKFRRVAYLQPRIIDFIACTGC